MTTEVVPGGFATRPSQVPNTAASSSIEPCGRGLGAALGWATACTIVLALAATSSCSTPDRAAATLRTEDTAASATFGGSMVTITEDVDADTLVVDAGQTLVVAHGVVLRATERMDVRGSIVAAPRSDARDGGSFSLVCDGPIHVDVGGLVASGDGTSGDLARDGGTDGGRGGVVAIECPVLVVDGEVRGGRGGDGGDGGSGGTGGNVHLTTIDVWCTIPSAERSGVQIAAGAGGDGGTAVRGLPSPSGGRGGSNSRAEPSSSQLAAWGLPGDDPEAVTHYLLEAGFTW
ncbi:hypothetical protein Pla163_10650 [Planctomycetes bacterium Pla163]|uniref:Uncharacterized protein n=1 Tax=Rohdeia mirabilis TaxID=2528008 RepID=A0A518CXL9_9BACT|nr:hypothetical protein Pla163_10650 [Planctomycetes bacterium Pla163]